MGGDVDADSIGVLTNWPQMVYLAAGDRVIIAKEGGPFVDGEVMATYLEGAVHMADVMLDGADPDDAQLWVQICPQRGDFVQRIDNDA